MTNKTKKQMNKAEMKKAKGGAQPDDVTGGVPGGSDTLKGAGSARFINTNCSDPYGMTSRGEPARGSRKPRR